MPQLSSSRRRQQRPQQSDQQQRQRNATEPDYEQQTQRNENERMNASQLRHRRAQIEHDQREERVITKAMKDTGKMSSGVFLKFYIVVALAIILSIFSILTYTNPGFLFSASKSELRYHFGTIFPPQLDLDEDLPRFFASYAVATPENRPARRAVRRVIASRSRIREAGAKTYLKGFDHPYIQKMISRNLCGPEFGTAYQDARQVAVAAIGTSQGDAAEARRQDLVMWCMMAASVVQGFFVESVDILDSAWLLARGRGIVGKYRPPSNSNEAEETAPSNRLSSALYVLPKPKNETMMQQPTLLPAKMLNWVLSNDSTQFESLKEYREALEQYLYELVSMQGETNYMLLDMECGIDPNSKPKSRRVIARRCHEEDDVDGPSCCDFTVPHSEGGRFDDDDDDDDSVQHSSNLRK